MWFARAHVAAEPADAWAFDIADADAQPRHAAIARGLRLTAAAHTGRGGAPAHLTLERLAWTMVDTNDDAAECAAAVAAWLALGHAEATAPIAYTDGTWRVTFSAGESR